MKKVILSIVVAISLLIAFSHSANAALIDNGDGTITDTGKKLMWLQDANFAKTSGYDADGKMTWAEAMTWAETLIYNNHDDWRLPSPLNSDGSGPCYISNCTDSEMGHIHYVELGNGTSYSGDMLVNTGPFVNLQPGWYYYNMTYAPNPFYVWAFNFNAGHQGYQECTDCPYFYSMAVRTASEPIPEPSTLFLLGVGLVALLISRRKL